MPSLMVYFSDCLLGQKPERDYLIAIISIINPEATKRIISEAREKRSLQTVDELDNPVKITPEFEELNRSTVSKKVTLLYYLFSKDLFVSELIVQQQEESQIIWWIRMQN